MSEQKSSWILELVDRISSPMKNVMNNTNQTSKSVEKLGTDLKGISNMGNILGTLGIGFGMFQVVSMMEKGIEKAHELHAAQAQIEAGLNSTGYAAGMTMQSIGDVAKGISSASLYGRADLLSMQSILVTFPDITSKTFGTASQAIADMSTRMKQDLSSTAVQVGKALQDPERGITALRRVGVNFNKEQTEVIKNLVANGKKAEAQTLILKELNTEFGGSAKAAFDADPLAHYNKAVGAIQVQLGDLGLDMQGKFAPILENVAGIMEDFATWVVQNKEFISDLGTAALIATGSIAAYTVVTTGLTLAMKAVTLWSAIEYASINILGDGFLVANVAQKLFAAGQWAINVAMDANPIGVVIAVVAALGTAFYFAWQRLDWFRGGVMAAWEFLKGIGDFIQKTLFGLFDDLSNALGHLGEAFVKLLNGDFKGAMTAGKAMMKDMLLPETSKGMSDAYNKAGKQMSEAYNDGVYSVNHRNKAEEDKKFDDQQQEKKLESLRAQLAALAGKKGKDSDLQRNQIYDQMEKIKSGSSFPLRAQNNTKSPEGSGSGTGGGLSGSGGGVGGVKSITQKIDIKNYFTVSEGSNVEAIAERVVRVINDRLRDGVVSLSN